MSEELKGLLEKIQKEGVEKAKSEADRLLADAKAKAASIVADAEAKAKAAADAAQKQSEAYAEASRKTIRQSADNIILEVRKSIDALLEKYLKVDVGQALADKQLVAKLAEQAVSSYLKDGNIQLAASSALAEALKARFAQDAAKGVDVVMDENTGAGFRVLLANGRVEHDFTAASIAEALASQVRPSLAALLKQ